MLLGQQKKRKTCFQVMQVQPQIIAIKKINMTRNMISFLILLTLLSFASTEEGGK
jgi:hypothetical protein